MTYKENYLGVNKAYSLIVQATEGCSYNKCTFCSYRESYRERDLKDIVKDLALAREHYGNINKVFIGDGDPLNMDTVELGKILKSIELLFPENEEVNIYASPMSILAKDIEELSDLRTAGLSGIYMGVESGSDRVLYNIEKGVNGEELVLAARKVKHVGMRLSTRVITGLGGTSYSQEHGEETGRLLGRIKPDKVVIEDIFLDDSSPIYDQLEKVDLRLLTPRESLTELVTMIEAMNFSQSTLLEGRMVANKLMLNGSLPEDKERILMELAQEIEDISYKGGKNKRI